MRSVHRCVAQTLLRASLVCVLLTACNAKEQSLPDSVAESIIASSTSEAVDISAVAATTAAAQTTQVSEVEPTTDAPTTDVETTLPAGPPMYEPGALGQSLDLPSFILTTTLDNTNNGQLTHITTTSGYVAEPLSAFELATFGDGAGGTRSFSIDGRGFMENNGGDWYLYEAGDSAANFIGGLDLRPEIASQVLTAQFDVQGEFAGLAANHFVFNETDLASYASYSAERPAPHVEGDLYVSVEGNQVLYAHFKETAPNRVYEVTETMSFIGLVPEITLPPDLAPMSEALDLGLQLTQILPPGAQLTDLIRYKHGIGIDYYEYRLPLGKQDEFLNFYRSLATTYGWSVSHVGHVRPHLEPTNCETDLECVILRKGSEQIVVSFRGVITLEYDHDHILSPA